MLLRMSRCAWAVVLACTLTASVALAADTLVVKQGATYAPGLAASWKQTTAGVVFELAKDVDGATLAAQLKDKLASAKVSFDGTKLVIDNVPMASLLEQLAGLTLALEADPLAGIAGMGGSAVASAAPEGGGSIRASKPTKLPAGLPKPDAGAKTVAQATPSAGHEPDERLEAEVLEVTKGAFPSVTLRLRVRRPAKAGELRKQLGTAKSFEASVRYAQAGEAIDFAAAATQRNLAAVYLDKGDRIFVHVVAVGADSYELDWVERKTRP